ncbi:MAG: hypothetical protein IJ344_06695, partial [Clostridia bacterium]|nr:hypothetical protein [Clostridia bacterium]
MSLYQEYQKRKNERTQSAKTSAPASSSLLEAYKDKKMAEAFKNGTAGKEIDAVLGRYGNAVSSYYDAAKGQIANRDIYTFNPDASAWNEQSKRALSGIGLLRQDVEGVLSKYSKYLDEDYLNKVYEGLDSDAKSYGDIAEAYRGQSEFYSSFGGERDFGVWANNQKKISAYDSLKENTDFDEEALRGASMGKNLPWDEMLQTGGSLTGNSVASIRTAYQSALAEAETNPTAADWVKRFETDGDSLYGYSFAVNMTDEEAKMYNYLFATEGEQSATEYLRAIEEQVNYRSAQKKYEQVVNSNFIDQLGFVAGTSFAQNIGDLADAFDTSKDYYTPSAGEMALGK